MARPKSKEMLKKWLFFRELIMEYIKDGILVEVKEPRVGDIIFYTNNRKNGEPMEIFHSGKVHDLDPIRISSDWLLSDKDNENVSHIMLHQIDHIPSSYAPEDFDVIYYRYAVELSYYNLEEE